MNNTSQVAFGQLGNAYVAAGSAHTPPAGKTIVAITFSGGGSLTATSEDDAIWPDLSGASVAAGATVYGRYTSVTPATSAAMVYYG